MNPRAAQEAALEHARRQLAHSRAELLAHVRGTRAGSSEASGSDANDVLQQWWDRHPLKTALQVAAPVLLGQAKQHPAAALLLAAAAGAALVLLRPWRALPWKAWALLRSLPLQTLWTAYLRHQESRRACDPTKPPD